MVQFITWEYYWDSFTASLFSEMAKQTSSIGNFTFNQNCPATSVNSYITCKELVVFFSRKLFHIQNYWSGRPILTFGKYNRLSSNTFPPDYTTIHIKDTIEIKPIKSLKWLKVILFISDREKKSWWRLKDIHHVRSNPLTPRCWLGIPTTGLQEMPGTQLGSVQ